MLNFVTFQRAKNANAVMPMPCDAMQADAMPRVKYNKNARACSAALWSTRGIFFPIFPENPTPKIKTQ